VSFGHDLDVRVQLLQGVWLFNGCSDVEIGRIAALTVPRSVATGTEVTREGDPGSEFFVVVEGDAVASVEGKKVGTIGAGGFFGEMALIDGAERVATVVASSPMQLLVLSRDDFNEMLSMAMPEVAPKLLAVVGARMRAIENSTGVQSTLGL
jgi:trk system potassium uptake protein TrkA